MANTDQFAVDQSRVLYDLGTWYARQVRFRVNCVFSFGLCNKQLTNIGRSKLIGSFDLLNKQICLIGKLGVIFNAN